MYIYIYSNSYWKGNYKLKSIFCKPAAKTTQLILLKHAYLSKIIQISLVTSMDIHIKMWWSLSTNVE